MGTLRCRKWYIVSSEWNFFHSFIHLANTKFPPCASPQGLSSGEGRAVRQRKRGLPADRRLRSWLFPRVGEQRSQDSQPPPLPHTHTHPMEPPAHPVPQVSRTSSPRHVDSVCEWCLNSTSLTLPNLLLFPLLIFSMWKLA